jgi:hypothetical protein
MGQETGIWSGAFYRTLSELIASLGTYLLVNPNAVFVVTK